MRGIYHFVHKTQNLIIKQLAWMVLNTRLKQSLQHRPFSSVIYTEFLRATAGTAIARLSHRNSVRPSVCLSVCHMGGSGKNGAS